MNIEQIKAQVAEWEYSFNKYKTAGSADKQQEGYFSLGKEAPAMFQAVKQLLARVETLENGIKSIGRDLMYEEPNKPIHEKDIVRKLTAILKQPE